ncbi:hypothetical protein GMORB2_1327 [Geosmithia morbida]|uniref:Alpha/beta-hydrolase n=1 Tax=Geosmithia morbida TaxID=1094350 RepID=A0A9P4YZT9_9HYPO|nr:uncharacterized protein GMORB2_1327 [Geosmithia morbida]KAF4126081.1 hypothetical protein GMORB2_1327 [Geosmithia morbida]
MAAIPDFYRSQIGGPSVISYSYTDSPWRLLAYDTACCIMYSWAMPWVALPLFPFKSAKFDELYPTLPNIWSISLHLFIAVVQLGFLVSAPAVSTWVPARTFALGVVVFVVLNTLLCRLLNGPAETFHSDEKYAKPRPEHSHEQWVFINGVAVGKHWMKLNLNRIAVTFGRPVLGIHNKTAGMIFDVWECLVQRNFGYATSDVRATYKVLKELLYNPEKTKVVLILHSQGAIVGGMCLDWLLQEIPQDMLSKIEVYTFGNAANHFNNPHRRAFSLKLTDSWPRVAMRTLLKETSVVESPTAADRACSTAADLGSWNGTAARPPPHDLTRESSVISSSAAQDRAIGHIEHYAHSTDFVAIWGILHFATKHPRSPLIPRFMGRLFVRARGGHQLCQHYLDGMFPLRHDPVTGEPTGADEDNEFMDEVVNVGKEGDAPDNIREAFDITYAGTDGFGSGDITTPVEVHGVTGLEDRRASRSVKSA